jgi:tetratricopeptide (TPR) repeat protein
MARAAVKAKQAQQRKAQPPKTAARRGRRTRHAGGGNPNQQLFFSRLRRRAKLAYLILAVLFAATFAFVGVGSGQNSGLDQLFQGLNIFHHSGTSVSAAEKEVTKDPAKGYRQLATAYESKGNTDQAINALQSYTTYKAKDAKAWTELAGLQIANANDLTTQYQNASATAQLSAPGTAFRPTGKLANAFSDPIETAVAGQVNGVLNDLVQRVTLAYQGAVQSYQQVAKLEPKNPDAEFQLAQAAQNAGNTAVAVTAYKAYLKLNPGSSSAAQIRQLIKQLQPAPTPKKKASK